MSENFQAVIFDLDGTLLDTLDDLADSMNAVLLSSGFPSHPVEKYRYFVGDGVEVLARRVLPHSNRSEAEISKCIMAMLKEYSKRWSKKTKLYNGVAQLLDQLAEKEVKTAILSNKPDHLTQKACRMFLSNWPFSIISGAKPDIPKKPFPDGALAIAESMGIAPEKFLYVGDTNTDMQTAISAKMYPAAALWGFRGAEELQKAGAKTLLEQPLDLMGLFK